MGFVGGGGVGTSEMALPWLRPPPPWRTPWKSQREREREKVKSGSE